jgi:hypothetical protein
MSILDIYDLFYKDDEPITNPDLNSFSSIAKLAPLSLWIYFNKKPDVKSFICPDVLRNHVDLIEDVIENQNYQDRNGQINNYTLSICLNACKLE